MTRATRPNPRLPRRARSWLACFGALAVVLTGLVGVGGEGAVLGTAPAGASPGAPGVPVAPEVTYAEDFEHETAGAALSLADYVGAGGQQYTADPFWLDLAECNGVIVRYAASTFPPAACGGPAPDGAQVNVARLADVLGQVGSGVPGGTAAAPANGSTAATQANHAVTAWTLSAVGADDQVQFQAGNFGLSAASARYYSLSIDVAEASCEYLGGVNNSQLDVFFDWGGGATRINAAPIRACTDPSAGFFTSPLIGTGWGNGGSSVRAGHFFSDGAVLLSPAQIAQLSVVIRNRTGAQAGNDSAFDNATVIDATPKLDKAFSPAIARVGSTSTLTYTITNRSDLGDKADWGFTDDLPAGLVVAPSPKVGGTCKQHTGEPFVVAGQPGAASVVASGGDLAAGESSCTIEIEVASSVPGAYTNGAANMTSLTGLDAPGDAQVRFIAPRISLEKSASSAKYVRVGEVATYTLTATNTGADPLVEVSITDPMPGLSPLACAPLAPAVLEPGASMTCTATRTITQADLDLGSLTNVASVSGLDPIATEVSATDSVTIDGASETEVERETEGAGGGASGGGGFVAVPPGGRQGAASSLPRTGSDVRFLITLGTTIVLAGAAFLVLSRGRWRERVR